VLNHAVQMAVYRLKWLDIELASPTPVDAALELAACRGEQAPRGWVWNGRVWNYWCDGDTGIWAAMERGEVQYLACTSDCNRTTLDAVYLTGPTGAFALAEAAYDHYVRGA